MTFAAAVALCTALVQHQLPVPRFDSYVDATAPTEVHMRTTDEQTFAFRKCLNAQGHPVESPQPD